MEHPTRELNQAIKMVMFVLLAPHLTVVWGTAASWSCCNNGRLICSFFRITSKDLSASETRSRDSYSYLVFLTYQKLLFFLISMNSRIMLTWRFFSISFERPTFSCFSSSFQSGQSSTVIENIHTIIAAAAVKFSSDQLNHLFVLIQKVSFHMNLHSLGRELMRHTCASRIPKGKCLEYVHISYINITLAIKITLLILIFFLLTQKPGMLLYC